MNIKRDYFGQIIEPQYILTKPSGERIGTIKCLAKDMSILFNAPSEINFETRLYIDGERTPFYDQIVEGQFIEIADYGRYVIISCETASEGTMYESKKCNAISKEVLLGQKYLELFTINMGTTESIDNVQFYNLQNPEHSLLHLVLEKCPDWEIGHVDTSLMTLHRCFEETRVDIYSFLTTTMAEAFQCVFLFDSYNSRINIYSEDTIGTNTDIYVTYQNLLKNTSISSSLDDIKTCLTVTGADDLNIREVNMGYDRIYMLDYFATTEYMSYGLYTAYNAWRLKWNSHLPTYTSLLSQYQKYYENIDYETNLKMSCDPTSTIWSEYGLIPLQEKQKAYEGKLAVMIKAGQGDPTHKDYSTMYLPCFNTIQSIKAQIDIAQSTINHLKNKQAEIGVQMNAIISDIDMTKNFTDNQLKELSLFIREDELLSDNYVVTDTMTDSERMDMLNEMLEFGQKELRRISQPQYQFSASLINLCAIPEFDRNVELFNVGNYIHIILRDDYMVKAKILKIKINFLDVNDFDVTFGTLSKLNGSNQFTDMTQAINTATSVATTVSFNASHWNKANKEVTEINDMLAGGLLAAGESLKTARSDVEIDDRGIIISNTPESTYKDDKIFIGDGKIMFSDDGLKTIKTAIGHLTYTKKGTTYTDFGVLAQFLVAGYIAGSTIEGNEIIGGTIRSSNYLSGKSGTLIDLTNGTFEFNANNEQKLTLNADGTLTVKGTIKADKGYIGGSKGFTIESGKLYSNKNSLTSNADGVYIGTDGIALGANSKFKALSDGTLYAEKGYLGGTNGFVLETKKIYNGKSTFSDTSNGIYLGTDGIALGADNVFSVTPQGYLTTKYGTIGGATISNDSIHASNNNWWISSDGSASFKNVTITGNSTFGSTVTSPFSGTTIPHIESLAANYIKVNYLDAIDANINNLFANEAQLGNLIATKASITDLDAAVARIGTLEADHVSVESLNAVDAKFNELNASHITSGTLSAARIDVKNLSIGANQITGTVDAVIFSDFKQDVISYLNASGEPKTMPVVSFITGFRKIRVLKAEST